MAGFEVWIVDGEYVRDELDEEFTNYGQHYQFNCIPKNEFWIDKETVPGEEKFYIDVMLLMYHLMEKGMSREKAAKLADNLEKKERAKSELMKREFERKKHKEEILKDIHKKLLRKYSGKIKVWVVNGELIRDLFFLDFTEGGHDKVYNFIPENEVWIDDDVTSKERKFVLLHELHERNLMSKGWCYDIQDSRPKSIRFDKIHNIHQSAHHSASEIEYYCRKHPELIDEKLAEEIN
jgi:hypothetical protein